MEDKQLTKNEFVREKIKDKPLNKRRIVIRVLSSALCGVVFAGVASVIFAIAVPMIRNRMNLSNPTESVVVDEEKDSQSESVREESTQPEKQVTEVIYEQLTLTIDDYQELQNQLYDIGEEANRAIVTVTGVGSDTDIFHSSYETEGQGSGIIIADENGQLQILTERRVIKNASEIHITFIDGSTVDAVLKQFDGNTGLAVLTVDTGSLSAETKQAINVASFGNSDFVKNGTMVIALGSPLGTNYSILTGNVTSTNNEIMTQDYVYSVFTTDIVASKSGSGVLINVKGEVIGIVMQEYSVADSENTLTAVSLSDISTVISMLQEGKSIPYLGLQVSTVTDQIADTYDMPKGVYIRSVSMDSPAMEAGLQSGDVIVQVNGENVLADAGYSMKLLALTPEDTVSIHVKRRGASGYADVICKAKVGVLP